MSSSAPTLAHSKETILVVDDNSDVLKLVVTILRRADYRVLSAHGPLEALDLAQSTEGQIHLLLSDVDMPTMRGTDLAELLELTRPGIRVVLMSGGSGGMSIDRDWPLIEKPFKRSHLIETIEGILRPELACF